MHENSNNRPDRKNLNPFEHVVLPSFRFDTCNKLEPKTSSKWIFLVIVAKLKYVKIYPLFNL
jgi:hypothetical protein